MRKKPVKIIRIEETPMGHDMKPMGDAKEEQKDNFSGKLEALIDLVHRTKDFKIMGFTSSVLKKEMNKDVFISYIHNTIKSEVAARYMLTELEQYLGIHGDDQSPLPEEEEEEEEDNQKKLRDYLEQIPAPVPPKETPVPEEGDIYTQVQKYLDLEFDPSKDDPMQYMKDNFIATEEELQAIHDRLTKCERNIADLKLMDNKLECKITGLESTITTDLASIYAKLDVLAKGIGTGVSGEYVIKYPEGDIKKITKKLPACWTKLLDLVTTRDNIFLAGPTQCGKTTTAEMVADAVGLRFSSLSCSEGMDESLFAGTLLPVGELGKFEYVPSTFVDFYENGGVYLLDEFCASDSNLSIFINNAIGNDHFFLPRRYANPRVEKHKDFVCIAADNTLGHGGDDVYVGRNQLDASTLERFRTGFIVMDYNNAIEKSISDPEVYDWCILIRNAIHKLKLKRHMTTRTMKRFTIMKRERNWNLVDMQSVYFADWQKDDVKRILQIVQQDISAQLGKK